jgi:hypothetical protein
MIAIGSAGIEASTLADPIAKSPLHLSNARRLVVFFILAWTAARPGTGLADEISSISCDSEGFKLQIERLSPSKTIGAHATVVYAVDVADQRKPSCRARSLIFQGNRPSIPDFEVFTSPSFAVLKPGHARRTIVSITPTAGAKVGKHKIPLSILGAGDPIPRAELPVEIAPAPKCFVSPYRELFVLDPSVVDDPIRTSATHPTRSGPGAWTLQKLSQEASAEGQNASTWVETFLDTWLTDREINGFQVDARPAMGKLVLSPWPRQSDGSLDLARAPFRLLAIVARIDLRDAAQHLAGELRFVFGLLGAAGHPMPFTLIFEYGLPAGSEREVQQWADRFHALGKLPFPSESYRVALQEITDAVVAAGAAPERANGSSLRAVRTNENALNKLWELREFQLSSETGQLEPAPVGQTPHHGHLNQSILAKFINHNEEAVLAGQHEVASVFAEKQFQAGAVQNLFKAWAAPGIESPEARRQFSLNTCDGCHGVRETGTEFVHVRNRKVGAASRLSGFLLGITVPDPVTGQLHTYNELSRRKKDLEKLVCK